MLIVAWLVVALAAAPGFVVAQEPQCIDQSEGPILESDTPGEQLPAACPVESTGSPAVVPDTGSLPSDTLPELGPDDPRSPTPGAERPEQLPALRAVREAPELLQFDVGEGVPTAQLGTIKTGIRLAQEVLDAEFGGDIRTARPITVKVVATGQGDQQQGGEGSCCTAFDDQGARPFFDVRHPGSPWTQDPLSDRSGAHRTAAHEYAHGWQNSLGCITKFGQLLPGWMNEGIAEYVGYRAVIRAREATAEIARSSELSAAVYTGEAARGLETLEVPGSYSIWVGHIGYLAVELLASNSPLGPLSVRGVCEAAAAARGFESPTPFDATDSAVDDAFRRAFGMDRKELYRRFPAYLESLKRAPISLAFVRRLDPGSLSWVGPKAIAYDFQLVGYVDEGLFNHMTIKVPPHACHSGGLAGHVIVALCPDAPAGNYTVSLVLPDGRQAQASFTHRP